MNKANDIEEAVRSLADERQAKVLQRFFKTGKGQYGEGDRFLGVRNPQVRGVVKEVWCDASLEDAAELARSPWHEVRLCGLLIMVAKYERAGKGRQPDEAAMRRIFETYLSLHPYINNWDLVDLSAYKIVGHYEWQHPETEVLDHWIRPEFSLWQRRISMVSTWMSIHNGQYDKALARAEVLLDSRHDLLHKAAGWMLREIRKSGGQDELDDFLERHVAGMPAVMLSYATEHMPLPERHYWQKRRKADH